MNAKAATLILATTLIVASPAVAGIIRGTLQMDPRKAPATPAKAQRGVTEAVVYLESVPDKVERKLAHPRRWFFGRPQEPGVFHIVQSGRQFRPRVAAVAVGTRVEFKNLDRVYHSTFSVSSAKRFDLGKYPPGRADTLEFDRPGVVNLHCDIHPDMVGYLVVTPNHAFTRPDSMGEFRLPSVPKGTYTVRVVHPSRGVIRQVVRVGRGDVALDLSYRR